jgi:hydroxyethylthiazole kinase-like uncharacterized protein yjeF
MPYRWWSEKPTTRKVILGTTAVGTGINVVTVDEMRLLEQRAGATGVSTEQLMENAGRAVAEAARHELGGAAGRRVVVLVGPGNNGGDGLVAAGTLARWGSNVTAYVPVERQGPSDLADAATAHGCVVVESHADPDDLALSERVATADLIIDALLGTGRGRPLEGRMAAILEQISRVSAPIISIDVPTGVDADTGSVDPLTVPADATIILGLPKTGLFQGDAAQFVGRLILADIGLLEGSNDGGVELIHSALARQNLPSRPLGGHKGSFGRALIVGGSRNYVGAPVLAARGAARIGAGLVTLATPAGVSAHVASMMPEATHYPMRQRGHPDDAGLEDSPTLAEVARGSGALVIGPGLGVEAPGRGIVEEMVLHPDGGHFVPLVLDADALNILAERDNWHRGLPSPVIITPHPGEMARLTGLTVAEVQADRVRIAREKSSAWGVTVVLKGAFTVVADPDGRVAINPCALPALSSAGTGDVLAGAIAGLLAQGVAPYEAACSAVYLHGIAGTLATSGNGDQLAGLLAGDVAEKLPAAIGMVRRGEPVAGIFA